MSKCHRRPVTRSNCTDYGIGRENDYLLVGGDRDRLAIAFRLPRVQVSLPDQQRLSWTLRQRGNNAVGQACKQRRLRHFLAGRSDSFTMNNPVYGTHAGCVVASRVRVSAQPCFTKTKKIVPPTLPTGPVPGGKCGRFIQEKKLSVFSRGHQGSLGTLGVKSAGYPVLMRPTSALQIAMLIMQNASIAHKSAAGLRDK